MRILWYNWRDIANPAAGGAEVLTHEISKRLVKNGYQITLFCASYPSCKKDDVIDGVRIIREGGKYSVYLKAKKYYKQNEGNFDLVIDEINTRPFLTPKFVKGKPILALIHQLAREFWFYETPFPINYFGYYYLERKWLSYYKDILTATVSNSTKKDLVELGFRKILVFPEGLDVDPLPKVGQKESSPTVVFMGRLKKAKLPDHALKAFYHIKKEIPDAKLWVIGDGYMRHKLEKMKIKDVTFYGHIENEIKYNLLKKAHLILVPAVREGWGLVVTESNAMGTPAIAYNVHGLRDSVIDGQTGILTKVNSPFGLAQSAIEILKNSRLLHKLSLSSLEHSRQFSWANKISLSIPPEDPVRAVLPTSIIKEERITKKSRNTSFLR